MLVRGTEERESGYLPTPTCSDATCGAILNENTELIQLKSGKLRKISNNGVSGSIGLARHVAMWPTPASRDYKGSNDLDNTLEKIKNGDRAHMGQLPNAVMMSNYKHSYPTPSVSGLDSGSGNCEKANKPYNQGIISDEDRRAFRGSGQLNPDWVEWLMGWPVGWTSLEALNSAEIRRWEIDPADTGEIPRVGVNIKDRAKRLKAIGNGQVPLVATMAFLVLSDGIVKENGNG